MSRFISFGLAACLLAIWTPTTVRAANPDWPKSLTLGTASPGGLFYVFGENLAPILTEKLGIGVNLLPTQGPVHNVKLLDSGGVQIGIITMGVALQGWNGTGGWTSGTQFRKMRALFPMWSTVFQAATLRRSAISTLADLEKRRVGVGPKAGAGGVYIPQIFKLFGISVKDMNYGSFETITGELLADRIDAIVTMIGAPMPAIRLAEQENPISLISLSSDQIRAIQEAMPELTPLTISAGTYRALDKDYSTVGSSIFAIGRPDLPDDLVYQLVKTVFENQPRLAKMQEAASEILPKNVAKDTFLPFHPGAVRYYREIGIKIPDELTPMN